MALCPQCDTQLPEDSLFCPRCGTPAPGGADDELLASAASDPTGLLDRLREATAGEFTIIRELGRGGMGRVYLAHELALDRRVAMKVLPPAFSDHTEIVQRFQREARTAGKLSHPHIVPVYQVSERAGLYFFTMPYIAGPSLRQVLGQTPQLDAELARRYLREAAGALSYAHSHGVIHRDIKPENMLMEGSRDGRLMLTDFGIAKALGAATTLTRPGDMMGTPYFMSPEQCGEAENIDGRSDQYSLGLVGYEMLAGRFPFTADSLAGIVYKHLHEYPEPLEEVRPDVPRDLRHVIERAIRKDPDERFPTMDAFLEALKAPGAPTVVGVGPPAGMVPRRARRRRRMLAGAAVLLTALGGAAALWEAGVLELPMAERFAALRRPAENAGPAGRPADAGVSAFDRVSASADSVAGDVGGPDSVPLEEASPGKAPPRGEATTAQRTPPPVSMGRGAGEGPTGRRQAEQARSEAELARRTAREAGADSIFPSEFGDAERRLSRAQLALRAGRLVPAAIGFATATRDFRDLAELARQKLAESEAVGPGAVGEPAAENPDEAAAGEAEAGAGASPSPDSAAVAGPEEAAEPPPPEEAIAGLIDAYRDALRSEDLSRLAEQVYRGPIPKEDERLLSVLLDKGDGQTVDIELQGVQVNGELAGARIKMRYQLARTREWRDLTLRMSFESDGSSWRLLRLERR